MFPCGTSFFGAFSQDLYWNALVPQTYPFLSWKISGCAPAFRHYSFCELLHFNCLTVLWIRLCLDNCSVICAITLCHVLHQAHSKIQSWSALLRHIHAYWDIIYAYSSLFSTLSSPHIHNLAVFWAYLKPCETLTRHIQKPTIGHYSAIFRTLYNASIRRNLAYSESWNIQNPSIIASRRIFRTLSYLKPDTYSKSSQRFKMQFFAKIVNVYNLFSTALHLRYLTVFWIRLSLNKYSLNCRVTSRYVLYDTYSEPCLLS